MRAISRDVKKTTVLDTTIFQLLSASWRDDLTAEIPTRFERHGDLVLLPQTAFASEVWADDSVVDSDRLWSAVAEVLGATRLARKSEIADDDFRSPNVVMLNGEDTWVTHVDNGIVYGWDIAR